MLVEKKVFYKELELILCGLIAYCVISNSSSVMMHIFMIVLVCLNAMLLVNFDFMHPYVWFSAFFGLYSVGYPLIVAMGLSNRIVYTKESILLELLALMVLLLIVSPKKNESLNNVELDKVSFDFGIFNRLLYVLLVLLIVLGCVLVVRNGFSGKEDVYSLGSTILKMIFRLPLICSLLYTLSVITIYAKTQKFPFKQMFITTGALLCITLFSGERDFIFRFCILNVFILWYLKLLKLKHFFVLVPVGVFGTIMSSSYKYYFLTGNISMLNGSVLYLFLSGEFESSSRNLQELINNSSYTMGIKGFQQLFYDFIAAFYSGVESTTSWFNSTFYGNSIIQYGFSLVGEGYVIGGTLGVVILFCIVGLIIKWFYRNANKSNYMLAAYMYFNTIVMYSIRADLSTIIAGIVKQIYLVLFILYLTETLSRKRTIKNNIEG